MKPLLYDELVPFYHLLDPLEDHADEGDAYGSILREAVPNATSLLELGSGAGHGAHYLRPRFEDVTLSDLSPAMLARSARLNPDAAHVQGDMRDLRLGRRFDCVLIHDAISYITHRDDLEATARTVFEHLEPKGAALLIPDCTKESFKEWHEAHAGDDGERSLRCLAWSYDPDPEDETHLTDFAFLLRERNGEVRAVHDRHVYGLFGTETWIETCERARLSVTPVTRPLPEGYDGSCYTETMFLCRPRIRAPSLTFDAMSADARERQESIAGCLLGGALGDALGGPYENREPPLSPTFDHDLALSDDTQLTLATVEALLSAKGEVVPEVIAATFARWFRERRVRGLGASTLKALRALAAGGHWALVGRRGEMAAGNGAAMRVAPLAFVLDLDDPSSRTPLRDVCRITHHSDEAYAGALAVALAIDAATRKRWEGGPGLLALVADELPDTAVRDRLLELAAHTPLSIGSAAERFGASGHVVCSVPLALVAATEVRRLGFEAMLQELIACGGDADTNATLAGQITGALLGSSKLPARLTSRLPRHESIVRAAADLAAT